jgi:hypothetical protein
LPYMLLLVGFHCNTWSNSMVAQIVNTKARLQRGV